MKLTDRKAIGIDDYMRTNVPHIYAIGDVTGKLMLAHVAEAMGVVAAETIAGAETLALGDYRMMPRATFCQPQVASFGLTEEQARDEGYDVKVAKFPFTANGKAHGLGDPSGFVKLIADAKYGELLGGHLIGPRRLRTAARAHAGAEVGPDRQRARPQRPHASDAVGGASRVLPRPGRPHDQLLRAAIWVAGIGGLVVGHILWLAGISVAIATTTISGWVLVVAAASFVVGAIAGFLGWRFVPTKVGCVGRVPLRSADLAGGALRSRARCDVPIVG